MELCTFMAMAGLTATCIVLGMLLYVTQEISALRKEIKDLKGDMDNEE